MKTNTSVTTKQTTSLDGSVLSEIKNLHSEILDARRTTIEKAIRVGELLATVKAGLNHGQWLPWVEKNLPFCERTARNYMRCFENRDRLKAARVADLGGAYALLEESTSPDSDETSKRSQSAIDEIVNATIGIFIAQGRSFTVNDVLSLRKSLAA